MKTLLFNMYTVHVPAQHPPKQTAIKRPYSYLDVTDCLLTSITPGPTKNNTVKQQRALNAKIVTLSITTKSKQSRLAIALVKYTQLALHIPIDRECSRSVYVRSATD